MNPGDFRIASNWDGDLSLICPYPRCYDRIEIKHNGRRISHLRKVARKHIKQKHPDVLLVAATGTPALEQQ